MPKELTRQAIIASFIKLLNQRSLDKIAVKDIVEDCGINRNTFYYHFQDIYALIEYLFESETRKAIEYIGTPDSWQDCLLSSVRFALQNKRAVYHIYNSAGRSFVESYLYRTLSELTYSYIEHLAEGTGISDEDINYIALFYKHAFVGIILEWLQKGMKDDAEKAIMRLSELFDGNIRFILENASNRKKNIFYDERKDENVRKPKGNESYS